MGRGPRHAEGVSRKTKAKGYDKLIICPDTEKLLQLLAAQTRHRNDLLFPRSCWNVTDFRAVIKDAAVALRWPAHLKWDGTHCLRHGGVARLKKLLLASNASAETRLLTLQMSEAMQKHYSRSNKDR